VAWYNGHPDYVDYKFDLSQESAAIIGLGNVAVDVARILCKTDEELKCTDMADYALEALRGSKVKDVYILGRRGPAQAAFTPPEIKEMGELEDTVVAVSIQEAAVDDASREEMEELGNKNTAKNVAIIEQFAANDSAEDGGKSKKLTIRFLVSPTEIISDADGRVTAIRIVKNEAYKAQDGSVRARATKAEETIPVGLVFRSVGYRGVPVPEIPFNESWGIVHNEAGRVTDESGEVQCGIYVAGWIKRGPTGVIGTNKTDAQETVRCMVEDVRNGRVFTPTQPDAAAIEALVKSRQPDVITYGDWTQIDAVELSKGAESGRPRVKFTNVESMLGVLDR
jgi:ferredoxin--NADP+ reductase